MHGRQWRLGLVMAIAALAACGGKQAPPAPPRPVLVVQPGGGPDLAFDAFAGEVRARNENPLSFRIGGNLARRLVFHAGTTEVDAEIRTSGGRVLCVTALGDNVKSAQKRAYELVDQIHFDGMQCRRDIGYRAVGRKG